MQDLKVTLIQTKLYWEDKIANREMFTQKISEISEPTDLIVLPEMFSTGFSMDTSLAETNDGETVAWLKKQAKSAKAVITGSIIVKDNESYYNRLFWVQPDGVYKTYDKRHLFTLANEQDYYSAGNKHLIVDLKGWKISPLICYDLRFPVWSRNTMNYDLLIYVANWPERRNHAWKTLLLARAIENQSYVVGVNRIGDDGNSVYHSGDSAVINPMGQIISSINAGEEDVQTITMSKEYLTKIRTKLSFLKDQDSFEIKV